MHSSFWVSGFTSGATSTVVNIVFIISRNTTFKIRGWCGCFCMKSQSQGWNWKTGIEKSGTDSSKYPLIAMCSLPLPSNRWTSSFKYICTNYRLLERSRLTFVMNQWRFPRTKRYRESDRRSKPIEVVVLLTVKGTLFLRFSINSRKLSQPRKKGTKQM